MRISASGDLAVIQVPLKPDLLKKARSIPSPRLRWIGNRLEFEPTPDALRYVQDNFPGLVWDDSMKKICQQCTELLLYKQVPSAPSRSFAFKTTPYEHQKKAFELSKGAKSFALLMEMGTGKSKVAIDTMAYQWSLGMIDAVLILAPNGVHRNWVRNELPVHMPDWVDQRAAYWNTTMNKQDVKAFETARDYEGLAIIAVNIEALALDRGRKLCESFCYGRKVLVVVDESTRIKSPDAKRTKAAISVGKLATSRRILTGTPVSQGPLDLYSQFEFLGKELLGFSNYWAFQANYAIMKELPGKTDSRGRAIRIVCGYRELDDLNRRMGPHSFRVTKEECLDLPPKVYEKRYVTLSDEQRKHYNELKRTLMTELDDKLVATPLAITNVLRLRQLLGGHLEGHHFSPNPRLADLIELSQDLEGKAIIWAVFKEEIAAIVQSLKEVHGEGSVVQYHGDVSNDDRARSIDQFQDPASEVRWFVGQPVAGGIGITLTQARTVIYYSNDYSLEVRQQSEDRAHRIGQTRSVLYIDYVAENTVDEKVIQALRNKRDLASTITRDELREWI